MVAQTVPMLRPQGLQSAVKEEQRQRVWAFGLHVASQMWAVSCSRMENAAWQMGSHSRPIALRHLATDPVGVDVGDIVAVSVGVGEGDGVAVADIELVGLADGVADGVWVLVSEGLGVAVGLRVGVFDAVWVGLGVGVALRLLQA